MALEHYGQLDELVRQEVNVKVIERKVASSNQGDLLLVWDGTSYSFILDGKDVTTPRLLDEVAPKVLEKSFLSHG